MNVHAVAVNDNDCTHYDYRYEKHFWRGQHHQSWLSLRSCHGSQQIKQVHSLCVNSRPGDWSLFAKGPPPLVILQYSVEHSLKLTARLRRWPWEKWNPTLTAKASWPSLRIFCPLFTFALWSRAAQAVLTFMVSQLRIDKKLLHKLHYNTN